MNPNTSDTPEQEMRETFAIALQAISNLRDRTISTVVSHSNTARELGELKTRFEELSERMNSVVQEAQRFRTDLHLTLTERDKYKKDAEDNLALANSYEQERNEARNQVEELKQGQHTLLNDLDQTKDKLEAANSSVARLGGDLDWLRKVNTDLRSNNDGLTTDLAKAQIEARNAQVTLNKLQGLMRDIFPETTAVPAEDKPKQLYPTIHPTSMEPSDLPGEAPKFDPPSVQVAREYGVNERIDQPVEEAKTDDIPWWNKPNN